MAQGCLPCLCFTCCLVTSLAGASDCKGAPAPTSVAGSLAGASEREGARAPASAPAGRGDEFALLQMTTPAGACEGEGAPALASAPALGDEFALLQVVTSLAGARASQRGSPAPASAPTSGDDFALPGTALPPGAPAVAPWLTPGMGDVLAHLPTALSPEVVLELARRSGIRASDLVLASSGVFDYLKLQFQHVQQPHTLQAAVTGPRSDLLSAIVIGAFALLFIYSLYVAITSESITSEAINGKVEKARFPHFDVMKFVLETLVVHNHLFDYLGFLDIRNTSVYSASFRMPAFMIISGIFGAHTSSLESQAKYNCCTIGTWCLTVGLHYVVILPARCTETTPTCHLDQSAASASGLWFLVALWLNHNLISPLFSRSSRFQVFLAFAFVKIASYFLMHRMKFVDGDVYYVILQFPIFAPFFAFGLLLTPPEWDVLLQQRWMKAASVMFFTAWFLLTLSPGFLQWNAVYCLPQLQQKGCQDHYDRVQQFGPVNISSFFFDHLMFSLRLGISVSFLGVVKLVCECAEKVQPQLIELVAGWGSRTLYTYVLHIHGFNILLQDGPWQLCHDCTPVLKWVLDVTIPVLISVVLSSQGTERCFHWLIKPLWILDLGNIFAAKFGKSSP